MKKNTSKYLVYLLAVIGVAIGVGTFVGLPISSSFVDDIATEDYWSISDTQPLSFVHTHIVCQANTQLLYKSNGSWLQVGDSGYLQHIEFSPISNSLTRFSGGADVTEFQVVNNLACDFPSWINNITVSGSSDYKISSAYGTQKTLLTKSSTIPTKTIEANKNYVIGVYQFDASDVEAGLVASSDGKVTLSANVQSAVDFEINSDEGSTPADKTFLTLVASKFLKQDNIIEPTSSPTVATGHLTMTLTSIQKVFSCQLTTSCAGTEVIGGTIDTSGGVNQQIQLKGILQDYDNRESNPQIKIHAPNGVQYGSTLTMIYSGISNDDATFKSIFYMPTNAMNGIWTVQMIHDQRQTSTKTFNVSNSVEDDSPITNPPSTTVFQAETGVGYTHVWNPIIDGITQTAVIDTGILDRQQLSDIPQLDILNDKDFANNCEVKPFDSNDITKDCGEVLLAGSKQLREVKLYPLILPATPEEAFLIQYVKSSTIKAVVSVAVGDQVKEVGTYNVISDPLSSASSIQCGATDIDGNVDANKCLAFTRGISLGRALIPTDPDLELKLFSLGLDKNKTHDMVLTASLSGTFELLAKDGVVYGGTLPQLDYSWSAIYQDPSFDGDSSCNSSDNSGCVDHCPDGTTPIVNVDTGLVECQDNTCQLLNSCPLPPVNDSDNDGIPDDLDSCPSLSGSKERNGCPESKEPEDRDGDGVPDAKDVCPDLAGTITNDGCPDNAPQVDTDGDGVPDKIDQCPSVKGLKDNYGCPRVNEFTCPDGTVKTTQAECVDESIITGLDTDGDTVKDEFDQCPNTPANTEVDVDGCSINQDPNAPEPSKCGEGTILNGITNQCIPKLPEIKGNQGLCFDVTTGNQIECPIDEQYIWYIAGALAVVGMIVFAIKRRN